MSSAVSGSNGSFPIINKTGQPQSSGPRNNNLTGGGYIDPPKYTQQPPTVDSFEQVRAAQLADTSYRPTPR